MVRVSTNLVENSILGKNPKKNCEFIWFSLQSGFDGRPVFSKEKFSHLFQKRRVFEMMKKTPVIFQKSVFSQITFFVKVM